MKCDRRAAVGPRVRRGRNRSAPAGAILRRRQARQQKRQQRREEDGVPHALFSQMRPRGALKLLRLPCDNTLMPKFTRTFNLILLASCLHAEVHTMTLQ